MASQAMNPLIGAGPIPKGTRAYDVQEIVQLYQEVQNISEVGRRTGLCNRTVRSYLDEAGQPKLKTKLTREHHEQMSKSRKGRKLSEECKQKIGRKGEKHNRWRGGKISVPCSVCGNPTFRAKSQIEAGGDFWCGPACRSIAVRKRLCGSAHWNWQGGITRLSSALRERSEYKQWRLAVLRRDWFTCQSCGKRGGKLHTHHRRSMSLLLREHGIKTMEGALKQAELWDVANGEALCEKCHKATDTYLNKRKRVS